MVKSIPWYSIIHTTKIPIIYIIINTTKQKVPERYSVQGLLFFQVTKMTLKANKTVNYRTVTFAAAGPFCPSSMSNET